MADDGLVHATGLRVVANTHPDPDDVPEVVIRSPEDGNLNERTSNVSSPDSANQIIGKNRNDLILSNPSLVPEFEDTVSLTWEDISVEVELPKSSLFKRCFKKDSDITKPKHKQILFDGV